MPPPRIFSPAGELMKGNGKKKKTLSMRTKKNITEEKTAEATPTETKKTRKAPAKKTATRKPRATTKKTLTEKETTETPVKEETTQKVEAPAEDVLKAENAKDTEEKENITATTEVTKIEEAAPATDTSASKEETVPKAAEPTTEKSTQKAQKEKEPTKIAIPKLPKITINNIVELGQAPQRSIILTDQQIMQLTMDEINERDTFLEQTLARILDYDVIISDTNIWLELLIGHTSSHSDPRLNARLQFERQLEFISKLSKRRGTRFIIMGETYEEIDRFASMQDPVNHKEADFSDNIVCLNAAARLAKRLILTQQKDNRLKIEGISAESHHASFADPAIIRRVVELFAESKKVLLITNDASVAIRSMGLCDDLQRINQIDDEEWENTYTPLRPMVFTFDDLKLLDYYTRQYYYIQTASGKKWMEGITKQEKRPTTPVLSLDENAFRPGDKHRGDNLFLEHEKPAIQKKEASSEQQGNQQKKQNNNKKLQQKKAPAKEQKNIAKEQKQSQQKQTEKSATAEQKPVAKEQPPQQKQPEKPAATEQKPTTKEQKQPQQKPAEDQQQTVTQQSANAPANEQKAEEANATEQKKRKPRKRPARATKTSDTKE